jgi:lysophospholipase L1-like esterase
MYFWNPYLIENFAPLPVIGHGFGGATYPEMLYFAPRLLFPYKPSIIVIYCENDQFNEPEKSIKQVKDDVCELFSRIHTNLPEAKIVCLAMKHSPGRDFKWKEMEEANVLIKQMCESTNFITYKDFNSTLQDAQGKIDSSLFESDYIHMNAKGYKKWAIALKPFLETMYASL